MSKNYINNTAGISNQETKNKTNILEIVGLIVASIIMIFIFFTIVIMRSEIERLNKKVEFEPIKEGLCIYIEYANYTEGNDTIPDIEYMLVIDYETDKVIEVDVFQEVVHTRIQVGDTILYFVEYDYTDADFLNVIKKV